MTIINPYKKLSKINPQRENGNRQIANDVYSALIMAKLSGGEYQVALFIIDQSWGFNKIFDGIAFSQIMKSTKLTRPAVINSTKKLERKRILVINRKVVKGSLPVNEYLFNKHYDTWLSKTGKAQFTSSDIELMQKKQKLVKQSLPDKSQTSKVSKQKLVKQSLPSKETNTKENSRGRKNSPPDPNTHKLINKFAEKYKNNIGKKPKIRGGRDGKLAKELVTQMSLKELSELLDQFFETTFYKVKQGSYSFSNFADTDVINRLQKELSDKNIPKDQWGNPL